MTDKKFKEQLIHLIKNDSEVWTLVLELAKNEINEVVKEEIRTIIFEERYFETPLRAYIKSLAYDDVHYLRMLNAGKVRSGVVNFDFSEVEPTISMFSKRKNVNLEELYKAFLNGKYLCCSYETFCSVLNFKHDTLDIRWIQKGRKGIAYGGIFDLFSEVYHIDFLNMNDFIKDRFLLYISVSFSIGENPFAEKKVKTAFRYYCSKLTKS